MEPIYLKDVIRWSKGIIEGKYRDDFLIKGISIDSRRIKPKELFIALKGEKFDGHDFVKKSFEKDACGAIVRKNFILPDLNNKFIIKVEDTLNTLGDIARNYRKMFKIKVIGITGSDGKTTTKEIIKKILSSKYYVIGTEGNLNNEIGLPLTLLNINKKHNICVCEMGMNKKGEIEYLSKILSPSIGIITNIGYAHIGFFKNLKEIAESKSELLKNLTGEKLAILNYDSPFFLFLKKYALSKVITFGLKNGADFQGVIEEIENDKFSFSIKGIKEKFYMNFWNPSWFYSGVIGIILGKKFGISLKETKNILESFKPLKGRGKVYKFKDIEIIDETYNSNPFSLKNSLYYFSQKNAKRKIAIIGDMAELGKYCFYYHFKIGKFLNDIPIDIILTFGEKSKSISYGMKDKKRIKNFFEISQLHKFLKKNLQKGDLILIKGSRIMGMERIIDLIKET